MADIIAANDIGTTWVKSLVAYKTRPSQKNRVYFEALLGEAKELDSPDGDLMGITTKEGDWFLGQSALDYCLNHIWGRGKNWPLSPHYRALHLYSIASHVGASARVVNVDLVSGLPRSDYKNRQGISDRLKGTHIVELPERERSLTININNVFFVIQGWSALFAEGVAEGQQVAWLGLGGRNKTYATVNEKGKIMPDHTGSNEGGLLSVVSDLASQLNRDYYIELSEHETIKALRTRQVKIDGEIIDVSIQVEKARMPYLDATRSLVSSIWNEQTFLPKIDDFRIGGGGALEIGKQVVTRQQMRVVADPVWSEVSGQLELGLARYGNGA